jgi:hypothetical protein
VSTFTSCYVCRRVLQSRGPEDYAHRCHRCEATVCGNCADHDYATDTGSTVVCLVCVEAAHVSGLSRWEVREAWDERQERIEAMERARGERS